MILFQKKEKEEFNIQEGKNQPRKRARKNGFKFNVGKKQRTKTNNNKKKQTQK